MRISAKITNYIKEIGVPEAAKFFGRKESTIKTWLKTESYPMDAVDTFMEMDSNLKVDPSSVGSVSNEVAEAINAAPSATSSDLEERVTRIENYLAALDEFNNRQAQPATAAPVQSNGRPSVQWDQPDPRHVGFGSGVRPADTVPTVRTLAAGEREVRPGVTPTADNPNLPPWMKPRQLRG